MLNNITNFFNLIKSKRIKTELESEDLIAIGTRQSKSKGDYKPTAIQFSDLQAQLGGGGITLTTVGTTGASTLVGSTLNIPDYFFYTYEIGEYVPSQGGVIFHRYKESGQEKYLIIDITDVSASSTYSNVTSVIGSSAQSTWDGFTNTTAIITQVGATSGAAFLCDASTNGGQNDWYLPAIDELNLIWNNRFNINKTLSGVTGAGTIGFNIYWSSVEVVTNSNLGRVLDFTSGNVSSSNKSSTFSVRAVRTLTI
jgi:hypothetical protein